MNQIIIRKALMDDLDVLLEFEKGIITAERPFDPTLKNGEIHYYDIAYMITATNVEVVVAEYNNEVVGSGYARIEGSKAFLKHRQHAFLGFMFVKPEFRGKGINKKIIQVLKQWAVDKHIYEFRLEVYNENQAAIKAYEKIGFIKDLIQMRLGLSIKG